MKKPIGQPTIRKGQRKPYAKATRQQVEERLQGAALLQFCGFTKMRIHRVFRAWYGVEWRQADRYMTRARANKSRLTAWPGGAPSQST